MNRLILVFALASVLPVAACGGRVSTQAATESGEDAGNAGSHAGANALDAGEDGGWCRGGPAVCGTGYPPPCTWTEVCASYQAATAERCEGGWLAFGIMDTESWEVYYYRASTGLLVGYADRGEPDNGAACLGPGSFGPPTLCTPDPGACGVTDAGDGDGGG